MSGTQITPVTDLVPSLHNHGGLDYGRLRFDRIIGRWRCVKCGRFA